MSTSEDLPKQAKKTEEEIEEEKRMRFEVPRKNCEQIAPEILRLKLQDNKQKQQHRLHILHRILKRSRAKNIREHMEHIIEFDKSEGIIPHGEVSKRLYKDIVVQRDFDLYGRRLPKRELNERKTEEMKFIARKLGIEYTTKASDLDAVTVPNIFANATDDLKIPVISTQKWKIGLSEQFNAPVGFAGNPARPYRSEGNEIYYAYDGDWSHGKMHGIGTYMFEDGLTYEGEFKLNKQDGHGTSHYNHDSSYSGDWTNGRFSGHGRLKTKFGSVFEGAYRLGRRHGTGKLELPCGLQYEGDWLDGKPHGRGAMRSQLTGYSYEGSFEKGSIRGSGVLITPSNERIVRYWAECDEELSLPGAVRKYLGEIAQQREFEENRKFEFFGQLRGMQLKDYVNTIRSALHNERLKVKKDKFNETMDKIKRAKQRQLEQRVKALTGESGPEIIEEKS